MVLDTGVDTSWHYIHSHGTRHRVKKHTSNYRWCACHILPLLGGGWKYRKGGEDIVTIFSPRGENIGGWKYRITPALSSWIWARHLTASLTDYSWPNCMLMVYQTNWCELIKHYLMGRQQCVKIGVVKSDWCELRKGGFLKGPFLGHCSSIFL